MRRPGAPLSRPAVSRPALRGNRIGPDGRWILPSPIREAIIAERTRRWTPAELIAFRRDLAAVEADLGDTWATELGQIRFLARSGPGRPAEAPAARQASTVSAPGRMPISTGRGPSGSPSA